MVLLKQRGDKADQRCRRQSLGPSRPAATASRAPVGRQAEFRSLKANRNHGSKGNRVIIEHLSPDAYGLLILAPEITLGSGWLGGDRVVGRAAIRDLLIKAARFSEDERRRLTIYLPSRALTLRLDEIERQLS